MECSCISIFSSSSVSTSQVELVEDLQLKVPLLQVRPRGPHRAHQVHRGDLDGAHGVLRDEHRGVEDVDHWWWTQKWSNGSRLLGTVLPRTRLSRIHYSLPTDCF